MRRLRQESALLHGGPDRVNDVQASYALARARVELLLAELREALARHEAARWDERGVLMRVERGLAALVEEARRA